MFTFNIEFKKFFMKFSSIEMITWNKEGMAYTKIIFILANPKKNTESAITRGNPIMLLPSNAFS